MESCRLANNNLSSYFCRPHLGGGGTLIYTKSNHICEKIANIHDFSIEKHCEVTATEVSNLQIIIVCIYRSPSGPLYIL